MGRDGPKHSIPPKNLRCPSIRISTLTCQKFGGGRGGLTKHRPSATTLGQTHTAARGGVGIVGVCRSKRKRWIE